MIGKATDSAEFDEDDTVQVDRQAEIYWRILSELCSRTRGSSTSSQAREAREAATGNSGARYQWEQKGEYPKR